MTGIEKFLQNSPNCEDLVLLLALENKEDLIGFFNRNELYNDLARKFFDLCSNDAYKVAEAIDYCLFMNLPKEIIQDNLKLENPVPLKFKYKNYPPYTAMLFECMNNDFYEEYENRKNNPGLKR